MSCKLAEYGELMLRLARSVKRPLLQGPPGAETFAHPFAVTVPMWLLQAHGYINTELAKRLNPDNESCASMLCEAARQFQRDHEELSPNGQSCLGAEWTNAEAAYLVILFGVYCEVQQRSFAKNMRPN